MLSEKTKYIVKSTVPVLIQHGTAITSCFYKNMFHDHPELLNLFNQSNQKQGRQQKALAQAVLAAAANIDNLEVILPVVKQVGHKHRSLGVKKEHYPIVGKYLLEAMKEVLGDQATDEVISAWGEAYGVIAGVFIGEEEEMYYQAENQDGGWSGFKTFKIANKVEESDVITSFYLTPADHQSLPDFLPGQYISVRVKPDGDAFWHNRQYSLSNAPGTGTFRISVKKEQLGTVSGFLHNQLNIGDFIEVSAPAGDFTLVDNGTEPITFLSGGVGVTPFISMLNDLAKKDPERNVQFIHAAQNEQVHAFKKEVNNLIESMTNAEAAVFYENTDGRLSFEQLQRILLTKKGDFYVCGPVPFLKAMLEALSLLGIKENRIHYEFFGPAVDLSQPQAV
ncbi:NO-inducible flavohemoprotein [Metabacillus sp. KIGAM252]|uniref:Flavohemoprotein n=1 Tax=Metabacillus flavus TaxID=2823519 RepID=A0ABS5LAA5_9BACI|nr:NO-inducible flavohemoprotein [Metabacillus flavus]MBS2967399.1 NO-inducible flavohemoprotein [Metabacillus flavus]